MKHLTRRAVLALTTALTISAGFAGTAYAQDGDKVKLRLASVNSETDQRAVALIEKFGPAVAEFAEFEPHWNGTLFDQGTELEAIARGNLEMSITSPQELAEFFPAFSIFTAGYVMRDAEHQVAVFNSDIMDEMKAEVEDELGVKLLTVMYLGKREINLRGEQEIRTPADLAGVKLRMPGTESWQFLGQALGASPVPMAFTEIYTALSTGAIDGQDNPLPTVVDAKYYEVTKQIVLTDHLVDQNYLAISKEVWDGLSEDQQAKLQKAADDAAEFGRQNQVKKEVELQTFLKEQGLNVYTPDVEAFRTHVQDAYLNSEYSESWPDGMLEAINGL